MKKFARILTVCLLLVVMLSVTVAPAYAKVCTDTSCQTSIKGMNKVPDPVKSTFSLASFGCGVYGIVTSTSPVGVAIGIAGMICGALAN